MAATQAVANPHPTNSPLEGISDLIDNLPLEACVELTRRPLSSISFLPKGAARQRAVLKAVILFVAEYGSTPSEDGPWYNPAPRLLECGKCARQEA